MSLDDTVACRDSNKAEKTGLPAIVVPRFCSANVWEVIDWTRLVFFINKRLMRDHLASGKYFCKYIWNAIPALDSEAKSSS